MLSAPIFSQIRLLVDNLNKKDFQATVAELELVRTWERTHACGLCVIRRTRSEGEASVRL